MKKFIITLTVIFIAVTSMAQNYGFVNIESVTPTAEQDKLMYASPCDIDNVNDRRQKIVTGTDYISGVNITHRMQHFLVECVAGPTDFSKGETQNVNLLNGAIKTMEVMPERAKVVGLALPGYLERTTLPDFIKCMYSYVFIKNLNDEPNLNPPYKDINYSNLLRESASAWSGDNRYFYKPSNNYIQVITKANRKFREMDVQSAANPYVLDMMFDTPFQYDGSYIHIAIELTPCNNSGTESTASNAYATCFSFPKTKSCFKDATIYHSYRYGNYMTTQFNFYQGAEQIVQGQSLSWSGVTLSAQEVQSLFNYFNFQDYTLPAFHLTYYTNDIRGTVLDPNGSPIVEDTEAGNVDTNLQPNGRPLIRLYDETDKKYIKPDGVENLNSMCGAEVNEDGSFCFSNLDHTHVYTLSAASSTCGYQEKTINFDTGSAQAKAINVDNAFKNDLVCDIRMLQDTEVVTAITDVAASTSPVAVDYYNVAGVRSATPFNGVNIVVTQYSDGSRTTEKMVK